MILCRSASNWLIRSWRRRASRAISLRFLPERRLALVNRSSRSLSSLIVRVLVFMSYNVRQLGELVNKIHGSGVESDHRRSEFYNANPGGLCHPPSIKWTPPARWSPLHCSLRSGHSLDKNWVQGYKPSDHHEGQPAAFTIEDNPYRRGGALIPADQFLAMLDRHENTVEIRL